VAEGKSKWLCCEGVKAKPARTVVKAFPVAALKKEF